MQIYRRLGMVVATLLAGCEERQSAIEGANASAEGGSAPDGGDDCPRFVVQRAFTVPIAIDLMCSLEGSGQIGVLSAPGGGPLPELGLPLAADCRRVCADASINRCRLSREALDAWNGTRADGGVDAGATCSFAITMPPQELTCEQLEYVGTPAPRCPVDGRRPNGLLEGREGTMRSVAAFLAASAELEAASVIAFRDLARELEAHGAPHELVAACEEAAREEVDHADRIGALARARGIEPAEPRVQRRAGVRPLVEIAIENAVEGTVRELFGAAQAVYRSGAAEDPEIREALRSIADDECGHAELSFSVDAFLRARLPAPERDRVDSAVGEAIANLRAELAGSELDEALARAAGLPRRAHALALLDATCGLRSRYCSRARAARLGH
jgi:hypothetical protein